MARSHAQRVYVDAKQVFTEQSKSLLTNVPYPHKWCPTDKTMVFGASSSLPPWQYRRGRLVCAANEKASLFLARFDDNYCRDSF